MVVLEVNPCALGKTHQCQQLIRILPSLQSIGVDVIYIMPFFKKGKVRAVGSPYCISNFEELNPVWGSMEDWSDLRDAVQENGMTLWMDWVMNHTAWDHPWVKAHPDWYVHDSTGKIVTPWDWTDVAQLNFKNPELRKAMIAEMQYWVDECDIDGFRCDVAFLVPKSFWEEARVALEKRKMMFMLAEMEMNTDIDKNPASYCDKAFDAYYGWNLHGASADCAKGKITGKEFITKTTESRAKWPDKSMMMSFLTNHD